MEENIIWIPESEVKAAYKIARTAIEPHLKREYRRNHLSKDVAVQMHHAILLGEEIVLRLSESGVSAVELVEWLNKKAETRTDKVKKEMATAA